VVQRKNRISLYNQEGIGLSFALKDSHFQYLENGDDIFYQSIFVQNSVPAFQFKAHGTI
jgi:hypothetical protein